MTIVDPQRIDCPQLIAKKSVTGDMSATPTTTPKMGDEACAQMGEIYGALEMQDMKLQDIKMQDVKLQDMKMTDRLATGSVHICAV